MLVKAMKVSFSTAPACSTTATRTARTMNLEAGLVSGLKHSSAKLAFTDRKLVCDWWLQGVPQLFYRLSFAEDVAAPCSCADVHLMPVPV